jgi:uncharacterized protein
MPRLTLRHACFGLVVLLLVAFVTRQAILDTVAEAFFLPAGTTRPAQYPVQTLRTAEMTVSDGTVLRADIHRPIGPDKTPTILTRIPFTDTFWNRVQSDSIGRFWAERGYAVVVQGTRGRYRSGGTFDPLVHEREDGIATLRWLVQQPWYDGRLAMWGGSAFGQTQWAISDQRNPGVNAFFVQIASSRFQDFFHPGGAFALESALHWALNSYGDRDRDVDMAALDRGASGLPVIDADDRAATNISFFKDWVREGPGSIYWDPIDGLDRARSAAAPMLLLAGWYDPFLPGMLRDFQALIASPASADSRLIIGPFAHAREISWPGTTEKILYRRSSVEPAIAWFDRQFGVGDAAPATPRIRIFVLGANVWRDESDWPLARTRLTPFYLQDDGALRPDRPAVRDAADRFRYDPASPVPTRGGAMLGPRAGVVLQDPVGARGDVLSYVSAPLREPMELTGPIKVTLWVSTDVPSTDFTAKLSFVTREGASYNLADGILRRSYVPGERTEIEIDLGATSVALAAGMRIRLDISSSNHPRFDRNPNTGENAATAIRTEVANQSVSRSVDASSHILLPVIPN